MDTKNLTAQLITIYLSRMIYVALPSQIDVCFISCDATAAFDRVYHKGFLYKLKKIGISGMIQIWIESYLTENSEL